MINLNVNITLPNINRWECMDFGLRSGRVDLRFWSPNNTLPQPLYIDVSIKLSDAAGKSDHALINASAINWNDKITVLRAVGGQTTPSLANAFANATAAYQAAANHNAGLRAIEGKAMDDNWVAETLNGT